MQQDGNSKRKNRGMGLRLVASLCLAAAGWTSSAMAQGESDRAPVVPYAGIGRIQWAMPAGFQYIFAVPHFTAGRRVMCAGGKSMCTINVEQRDFGRGDEQRRNALLETAREGAKEAGIKVPALRTFGDGPQVSYVSLEDPRPGQEYRYMALGYALNGPAVLRFELLTNDARLLPLLLKATQAARPLDALPVLAMRLDASRNTCNERYNDLVDSNDAAFRASPFAAVDVAQVLKGEGSVEAARAKIDDLRRDYAKEFDADPEAQRLAFCKNLPTLIGQAAASLPRP